ncbi:XdhC family protein [Thalassotalea aquiviva]|uniref:XdhC family protein n=1 Tax=Thalassotalea aquiviva TaxID=3242415 RepID=UPI00352B834E
MQLSDKPVIEQAVNYIQQNKPFWLCTILNTYGSAPRPIGSIFVTDGGQRFGSISGGCLEDAFVEMLKQGKFNQPTQLFTYGQHAVSASIYRELPCGGTIELLVEYIPPVTKHQEHFQQWLQFADKQQPFSRVIELDGDAKHVSLLNDTPAQQVVTAPHQVTLAYEQVITLLLIGIGQVTEQLARLGILAGYQVKVCDTRKGLSDSWHFNKARGGVDIIWMSPDLFVEKYANGRSAVLALAHDPSIDDVALMSVFDTSAFYIGAMGSTRTSNARIERLQRICDIPLQQLERLHAPIGLNIGSKTPVEIAIATLADIIRVQHKINKEAL